MCALVQVEVQVWAGTLGGQALCAEELRALTRTRRPWARHRVKNKFAFSKDDIKGGYRDIMMSVLFQQEGPDPLRIIGEIQIQDQQLYALKCQVCTPIPGLPPGCAPP